LTALYTFSAVALVFLLSLVAYRAIERELQANIDLALRYRMAQQLQWQGFPLPSDLESAGFEWGARSGLPSSGTGVVSPPLEESTTENEGEDPHLEGSPSDLDEFDAELAPVFVLSSASQAYRAVAVNQNSPLTALYAPAAEAALAQDRDLRTITLQDGGHLRLLSYRLPGSGPAQVIQVGRLLDDQQRVLDALLRVLFILGGIGALLIAGGSWWVAGRSIAPAQAAWEKQQAFVANASHELRSPLTVLRASAEVAQRGMDASDSRHALLDDILQEVDHMAHLVDDLLLLSRLDAGRLALSRERIELAPLLDDLERKIGRIAQREDITLVVEAEQGLAALADRTRLRQVLLILLDNALRHTPGGGRVSLAARSMGRRVEITVSDTGEGIDAADLPHVFERFYRSTSNGDADGSGLGLAIAKGLTEAQGGTIDLLPRPGVGTSARLTLPAA
jgi:signal transduction histidine kinase